MAPLGETTERRYQLRCGQPAVAPGSAEPEPEPPVAAQIHSQAVTLQLQPCSGAGPGGSQMGHSHSQAVVLQLHAGSGAGPAGSQMGLHEGGGAAQAAPPGTQTSSHSPFGPASWQVCSPAGQTGGVDTAHAGGAMQSAVSGTHTSLH